MSGKIPIGQHPRHEKSQAVISYNLKPLKVGTINILLCTKVALKGSHQVGNSLAAILKTANPRPGGSVYDFTAGDCNFLCPVQLRNRNLTILIYGSRFLIAKRPFNRSAHLTHICFPVSYDVGVITHQFAWVKRLNKIVVRSRNRLAIIEVAVHLDSGGFKLADSIHINGPDLLVVFTASALVTLGQETSTTLSRGQWAAVGRCILRTRPFNALPNALRERA